jgi:hypothetical protein
VLEAPYRTGGAGQAPFAPAMMVAVLVYAYANGRCCQATRSAWG